jgi:hypothetical protein
MTEAVKIETLVAEETSKSIDALIAELGYEREEGLRMILGAGLMALRNANLEPDPDVPKRGRARWLEVERDLAVTHFRLYKALEANRNWELSTGAVLTSNEGLETLVDSLNKEVDDLKKKLWDKNNG